MSPSRASSRPASSRRLLTRPSPPEVASDLTFVTEEYLLDEIERARQIHELTHRMLQPGMPGDPERILAQFLRPDNNRSVVALLQWLYQEAMPDAVDHLDLAAFVNQRAQQPVPLFHLQLVALRQTYGRWQYVYNLMTGAAQAMNQAKHGRATGYLQPFHRGWDQGLIPHTVGADSELSRIIRQQRELIETSPSPQQWTELTVMAREASRSLSPTELRQFKVDNAMNNFGIPRFMAELLTYRGAFDSYNGLDYGLYNRRLGFARLAAVIVDFLLDQ